MTSERYHSTKQLKEGWTSVISGIRLSLSDLLSMTSSISTGQDTPLPLRFTVLYVDMCSLISGHRQVKTNPIGHFA